MISKISVGSTSTNLSFKKNKITLIETNVDDVTGEIIGHTLDHLIQEGALDATATPFVGKKGRPGFTVRVTCLPNSSQKFAALLVRETGTFGVKVVSLDQLVVRRKSYSISIIIKNITYKADVKIAKVGGEVRIKPEFDDAKSIALKTNTSLRTVLGLITEKASEQLPSAE